MSEAEAYLQQFQSEAEHHSSGAFTLDTQHLAESALGFQKAQSAFWLLRCMQALHRAHSQRIEVQLKKRQVRLLAEKPQGLAAQALFEVLRGAASPTPAQNHLRFGFLALLALRPRQLIWCSQGQEVVVSGVQCWLRPASPGRPEGLEFSLSGVFRPLQLLGLHFAASHRLAFGTAEVSLDGRRLLPDWPPPRDEEGTPTTTGLALERYQLAESGFPFPLPDLEHYAGEGDEFYWNAPAVVKLQRRRTYAYPTFVYQLESGGPQCSLVCALPQDEFQEQAGTLLLVRDGVLLEEERLELGISGALVMADARELSVDASGLRAVRDEAFAELQRRIRGQLALAARGLLRQSGHMGAYVTTAVPSALAPGGGLIARAMRATLSPVFRALMNSGRARQLEQQMKQRLSEQLARLEL